MSCLATRYICNDQSVKCYSFILILSTLCVVHDLIFQRKLSLRRLPITFVHFVSHSSAQALRSITFTQIFRTTGHLFSIQLFRKPKILELEDKQTKFEQSKGDLGQFSELCKWSLTRAQFSKHMDLRCFQDVGGWKLDILDISIPAGLRQSETLLAYKLCTNIPFWPD